MKIAIATQDLTRIDAHLGWARHLMFFEVSAEGYRHLDTASFTTTSPPGDHAKLEPRLAALDGCALVFVAEAGPEGELGLGRRKVTVLRKFAGHPVADALDALRDGLRDNPPAWLRRCEQNHRRRCVQNGD